MTDTFKDGIEAAVHAVEELDCIYINNDRHPFGGIPADEFSSVHRAALQEAVATIRALLGYSIVVSPLTEAFEHFKLAFISAGGTRNPKSASAKGWRPAEVVFTRLVRKDKHDSQAIVTGTQAYAAYMRRVIAADLAKVNYVPAPKPFLNGEQFMQDWGRAKCEAPAASMFDVAHALGGTHAR
jgi:hypothetical protein